MRKMENNLAQSKKKAKREEKNPPVGRGGYRVRDSRPPLFHRNPLRNPFGHLQQMVIFKKSRDFNGNLRKRLKNDDFWGCEVRISLSVLCVLRKSLKKVIFYKNGYFFSVFEMDKLHSRITVFWDFRSESRGLRECLLDII